MQKPVVLIGGVSTQSDFSSALIAQLLSQGYHVVAVARSSTSKESLIDTYAANSDVEFVWGDLQDSLFIDRLVACVEQNAGPIDVYIHNAAKLVLKPFLETTAEDFEGCWQVSVNAAATVSRSLLPSMLLRKRGVLIFTGASASIRGKEKASPFAVAKFGLRALSQSLAREFGPQGIHVTHVITDGVILGKRAQDTFNLSKDTCINPEALARVYQNLIAQDDSCWTQEIDVRPYVEKF